MKINLKKYSSSMCNNKPFVKHYKFGQVTSQGSPHLQEIGIAGNWKIMKDKIIPNN